MTTFAEEVIETARTMKAGKFSEHKAFIHAVWAVGGFGMNLPQFKAALLQAHRDGLVRLCRLDLVEAANINDVRMSRIEYMGAEFNLIKI